MRQGHRQGQGRRNGSGRSGALCVGLMVITLAACSGGGGRRFFTVVDDGGTGNPGNDGGGQGAPDLASARPDLAQLAYPSGPYGNQIGDVLDRSRSCWRERSSVTTPSISSAAPASPTARGEVRIGDESPKV